MSFSHDDTYTNTIAEGSKKNKHEVDESEDPFVNTTSKNQMPALPSKSKKVYLEDYENFSVK